MTVPDTQSVLDLLLSLEWSGGRGSLCPACGADARDGHREECHLAHMVKDLKEALTPAIQEPDRPLRTRDSNVVNLDEYRVRVEREFEDEAVAYVEALWGKETFGYNVAIRDLEDMRRGVGDKSLRPPQTYHEVYHMVVHIRALANDVARHFGVQDLVRPADDLD